MHDLRKGRFISGDLQSGRNSRMTAVGCSLVVLGYSFLLKSRLVNNCLLAHTGTSVLVVANNWNRPNAEVAGHRIRDGPDPEHLNTGTATSA
jgi:hypothetical protein